jgi:hypothetical protein
MPREIWIQVKTPTFSSGREPALWYLSDGHVDQSNLMNKNASERCSLDLKYQVAGSHTYF